ncbi:MAG: phosphoribosylaminoimidazole-succinocarboxamide synthase [Bradymonadia bacterium]|jgi:phosphoribosylaminoimidazole-succinocarboxamide synthase
MIDDITLRAAAPHALARTDFDTLGTRIQGKVRDLYCQPKTRLLIATDRLSAFDRVIGAIPFKGQVLNQLSAWWFEQTADIVANQVLALPDPNVTVAHEAQVLPVEVVVRGYITGVTSTSLWTLYEQGVPRPYGLDLPAGLAKNDRLDAPVITPTTKAAMGEHDERLTSAEVVEKGLVDAELWTRVQAVALEIFARGQAVAAKAGLILVDTKYEFGLVDGELVLIDEVHTPDSSRYWIADTWPEAPKGLSKEYVRQWLKSVGYTGDGPPPALPLDVVCELARRYIDVFERLTGTDFVPGAQPLAERMSAALADYSI